MFMELTMHMHGYYTNETLTHNNNNFQYSCSAATGVAIIVSGLAYQCSCEGEQVRYYHV